MRWIKPHNMRFHEHIEEWFFAHCFITAHKMSRDDQTHSCNNQRDSHSCDLYFVFSSSLIKIYGSRLVLAQECSRDADCVLLNVPFSLNLG